MESIETLRAVHHSTRRRIIEYLFLHGPSQVGTLAGELDQQVGSISHHLRILERVEVVARAPELSTDGRTSWWRLTRGGFAWAPDDYSDSPADRMQAKAAERASIDHQLGRLAAWKRRQDGDTEEWRRAAFSNDMMGRATPDELRELSELLTATWRAWREAIDLEDGQERRPVFFFTHGFPFRP